MKTSIAIIAALLFSCACSIAENEFVTLTSTDGKTISAKLVSKDETSVLIEMENGKEFQIPYTRLSEIQLTSSRIGLTPPWLFSKN